MNGRGIDEKMVKNGREGHWGLRGMRERAAAIHGRLRILSKIGAGTGGGNCRTPNLRVSKMNAHSVREHGLDRQPAVRAACESRRRLTRFRARSTPNCDHSPTPWSATDSYI
jgi:hypothetical protein